MCLLKTVVKSGKCNVHVVIILFDSILPLFPLCAQWLVRMLDSIFTAAVIVGRMVFLVVIVVFW